MASGSAAKKKKYIFFDKLTFLDKAFKNDSDNCLENKGDIIPMTTWQETDDVPSTSKSYQSMPNHVVEITQIENQERPWIRKRKCRTRNPNQQQTSQFGDRLNTMLNTNATNLAADDMAFFMSLGPILKSFTTHQKLMFRSEVLKVAMQIENGKL